MKIKSTFLKIAFTLILAIGFILPSCNNDDGIDCDCPTVNQYFDIGGLDVLLSEENGIDNSAAYRWSDLLGTLDYDVTYYGNLKKKKKHTFFTSISLIPTASACSCLWNGYAGSEEGIESLTFKTIFDYNVDYPAGSDISDIIRLNLNSGNYESVDNFITENNTIIFNEFSQFKLEEAPTANSVFQLEIEMTLTNGETHSILTDEITLSV